jgi:calcineurin-like phosphoesterase family protein
LGVPFALIPGSSVLLPIIVSLAKKRGLNILPSSFNEKEKMTMNLVTTHDIWFVSDTHYMHTNICRGVTKWKIDTPEGLEAVRDFNTLEEMNEALVNNINKIVKPNDWLIHIGDWSFGGFEMIEKFRSQINCKNIILILGNHDQHILRNKNNVKDLFAHVTEEMELTVGDHKFHLSHYPHTVEKEGYRIHGHIHSKGEKRFTGKKMMDVGICGSPEFRPYHIQEVIYELHDR